jgi:hypothetical protein
LVRKRSGRFAATHGTQADESDAEQGQGGGLWNAGQAVPLEQGVLTCPPATKTSPEPLPQNWTLEKVPESSKAAFGNMPWRMV